MRECYSCGSIKTYVRKDGSGIWIRNRPFEQWLCERCDNRLIRNPKYLKAKLNRTIRFGSRQIILTFEIRKGLCIQCGSNGPTDMHHEYYIPILPWSCTVELCNSCHKKIITSVRDNKGRFLHKISAL